MEFRVTVPTVDEEWANVRYVLANSEWYKKHGYSPKIPEHPDFEKCWAQNAEIPETQGTGLEKTFRAEIFDPTFYADAQAKVVGLLPQLKGIAPFADTLTRNWGLKQFPEYKIALRRFGNGGQYDDKEGLIIVNTAKALEKNFLGSTVIHELLHIGIEENIVRRFDLTQAEKERTVDLLCVAAGIRDYKFQRIGEPKMDAYLPTEAIVADLPAAVARYRMDFPAKRGPKLR